MRFSFTGTLSRPKPEKMPFIREGVTKTGNRYKSLNLNIVVDKSNFGYVELMATERRGKDISCQGADGSQMTIDWGDRLDPDIISKVSSRSRYVVGTGTEKEEFITSWDFVKYIEENIEEMEGKKYTVTGRVRKDPFNDKILNKFEIHDMYPASEKDKEGLRVAGEVFFTADGIDLSDWKSEKKIIVNGYTNERLAGENQRKMVPQTFIFDASKVETHLEKTKLKAIDLGVELDDKLDVKCILKKKKVYRNSIICKYINGSEEVEFSEDMLTDYQKARVAAGLKTLDDYRPTGRTFGERVVMLKIYDFTGKGRYENGLVLDEDMDFTTFQDSIYRPPVSKETTEEILKDKSETKVEGMNPPEEDDEDIFG